MSLERSRTQLKAASAIVIVFGIAIALAAHPGTSAPVALVADLMFWPLDGVPVVDAPATRLMCAIAGGVMVGWGVLIWHVVSHEAAAPTALRRYILASVAAWFVVDSIGSIAAGAVLNAVANVGFLMLFAVPIVVAGRLSAAPSAAAE